MNQPATQPKQERGGQQPGARPKAVAGAAGAARCCCLRVVAHILSAKWSVLVGFFVSSASCRRVLPALSMHRPLYLSKSHSHPANTHTPHRR